MWGGEFDMNTRKVIYPNRWRKFGATVGIRLCMWSNALTNWTLHVIPTRKIGGPHDGARFNDETPQLCADRLEMLRAAGYNVPDYAIERLRKETAE